MNSDIEQAAEQKLSFAEWIAFTEESTLQWANDFIEDCVSVNYHDGDCTNKSHSCPLCVLERELNDYYEYCKKKGFVKDGQQSQQPESGNKDEENKIAEYIEKYRHDESMTSHRIARSILTKDKSSTFYIASQQSDSDAVEFYKWIKANYYSSYAVNATLNSPEELYKLFKNKQ